MLNNGLPISKENPLPIEVLGSGRLQTFAKEVITVSTTVKTLSKTFFQDADEAYITIETADIRVLKDGSTPTATDGHIHLAGSSIVLTTPADIARFKAIRAGGTDAKITVSYSRLVDKPFDPTAPVSKLISVASRNAPMNQGLSDGVLTNETYKVRHIATTDLVFPRLAYPNWYLNNGETNGPNDITVKAAIEVDGNIYPALFGGANTKLVAAGATEWTDAVRIFIPKGTAFYTRTNVQVTAGQKWPLSITAYPADGEGRTAGDVAHSGATTNLFIFTYSPCAIVGQPANQTEKSVLLVGDSIASGQGETPNDRGFLIRAINDTVGHLRVSKPSARTSDFLESVRKNRMQLASYCNNAIIQLGVNDVKFDVKLEVIKANLLDIWTELALNGVAVFQTTITPVTTSTDSWATTKNQSVTAQESVRIALNDWIRSCPAPLSGYFDVADEVETARNSGIWIVGYTTDGTHPIAAGHAAMATGIDLSKFR